jgi:hypothetical protein
VKEWIGLMQGMPRIVRYISCVKENPVTRDRNKKNPETYRDRDKKNP